MGKTLFDKIWDYHRVGLRGDGRELLYIDRHAVHELHAPHAFGELDASGREVRRRDLTMVVQDHTVPTRPGVALGSTHIDATRLGSAKYKVRLIDVAEAAHGIVHVVTPELGVALPGLTLACPDAGVPDIALDLFGDVMVGHVTLATIAVDGAEPEIAAAQSASTSSAVTGSLTPKPSALFQ